MITAQRNRRRWSFALRAGLLLCATSALVGILTIGSADRAAAEFVTPHGGNTVATSVGCAACHSIHRDQADTFSPNNTVPRSLACLSCHDGTGANSSIGAQYNSASPNDPDTRTYYSHPANATNTGHMSPIVDEEGGIGAPIDEFGGVLNRHSDCVDCHNPHVSSTADASTETVDGWTLSGSLKGVSVVTAAFPANPDTAPTYTFVSRGTTANYEYELCLKCHSSFTNLPSNTGWERSKWYLDFGKLLNPNNTSFHPITAAGKNQTAALTFSLAGDAGDTFHTNTSLTVNSVISCSSCHGAANGGVHATGNPNMLLFRYRSEVLKLSSESYDAAEFKLCFTCHSDKPFREYNTTHTNFPEHFGHVTSFKGSGTDNLTVNDAGAGAGHALCVECHWESHSSGQANASQTLPGTRLVQFAPNVEPNNGSITYVARNGGTAGGCNLICHGVVHTVAGKPYPAP